MISLSTSHHHSYHSFTPTITHQRPLLLPCRISTTKRSMRLSITSTFVSLVFLLASGGASAFVTPFQAQATTLAINNRRLQFASSPSASASSSYVTALHASNFETDVNDEEEQPKFLEKLAATFSGRVYSKISKKYNKDIAPITEKLGILTTIRVFVPAILAGFAAFYAFPGLALWLSSLWSEPGVLAVLSQDSSQFVQNFLTVAGLLFSILVGQTYYFMYQQQEMVYYALFNEVTEAKSLLEQVALVCQGRSMYPKVLAAISQYVKTDLKKLQSDPAVLLSARPVDDPLETIMYLTSVGVPSTVYDTVRSLRQARAQRLGALQRKLPTVHMVLLWVLAFIELMSFPLLGAGTQTLGGYNLLTVEGCLFGVMTAGIVLTMRVSHLVYLFFAKC
jgi:hypothetical protein